MIQMEIDGIYREAVRVQKKKENRIEGNMQAASISKCSGFYRQRTMTTQERECGNPWLCSMIGVLFGAEMCKRRCGIADAGDGCNDRNYSHSKKEKVNEQESN